MLNCLCPSKFCGIGPEGQGDMGNLRTVKDKGDTALGGEVLREIGVRESGDGAREKAWTCVLFAQPGPLSQPLVRTRKWDGPPGNPTGYWAQGVREAVASTGITVQ